MPVKEYKGRKMQKFDSLGLPTFCIYHMNKELEPLKDTCVWIRAKDVIKWKVDEGQVLGGKFQKNYMTDKKDWIRGLQQLIEEFRRIVAEKKL